jgi:RNA polymerase sigma-70 factor (ECF subfamily)
MAMLRSEIESAFAEAIALINDQALRAKVVDAFVLACEQAGFTSRRDLEEMPTAEVAEVLGLEPATVRQRVHRARLMLRGYLGDLGGVKP